MKTRIMVLAAVAALAMSAHSQGRSPKRGCGWEERAVHFNSHHAELLKPGVSWLYNWGNTPHNGDEFSEETLSFAPMCWNSHYDSAKIRAYVAAHPETRYLLGFNEPNFQEQSNMTPAQAAQKWPEVEALAAELDLVLVGPALNFSGQTVGGRVWSPYEWLDEFVRIYPQARMDCLALHCYMNWYSATAWFATEYFYKDLYDPTKKDVYGKYPNLVAWLDGCKETCGHFPRMMFTEFCAWENDGAITGVDFQIDQMTQKVQLLEQSDLVEGYAWFMANANASSYPYMSLFETNSANAELSDLGKVYVHMSSFDREKYYSDNETVMAKDYVEATRDAEQIKLRPNSEDGSEIALQVEVPVGGWMQYQVEVPEDGDYLFTMHVKNEATTALRFYIDSKVSATGTLESTGGSWADRTFTASMTAGQHDVMFYNASTDRILLNSWKFGRSSAGTVMLAENTEESEMPRYFDLQGKQLPGVDQLERGIYIVMTGKDTRKVTK